MAAQMDPRLAAGNRRPMAHYRAQNFRWEVAERVGVVTLDRPERKNPLTFDAYAELRGLFRDEMVALQGAMLELVPAIVSGDTEAIARLAERMRAGYVLAQKLTDAQREELERALPAAFLERDGEFHELAGGLAEAARKHQAALVPFYFYKLTESCVGCHARYAGHRFPGYAQPPQATPAHAH